MTTIKLLGNSKSFQGLLLSFVKLDLGGRSSPSGGGEWPTVGGTDRAHGVGGKMEGRVLRGPRWEGCEGCEPEVRKAVGPGREGACGLGRGTCTPS